MYVIHVYVWCNYFFGERRKRKRPGSHQGVLLARFDLSTATANQADECQSDKAEKRRVRTFVRRDMTVTAAGVARAARVCREAAGIGSCVCARVLVSAVDNAAVIHAAIFARSSIRHVGRDRALVHTLPESAHFTAWADRTFAGIDTTIFRAGHSGPTIDTDARGRLAAAIVEAGLAGEAATRGMVTASHAGAAITDATLWIAGQVFAEIEATAGDAVLSDGAGDPGARADTFASDASLSIGTLKIFAADIDALTVETRLAVRAASLKANIDAASAVANLRLEGAKVALVGGAIAIVVDRVAELVAGTNHGHTLGASTDTSGDAFAADSNLTGVARFARIGTDDCTRSDLVAPNAGFADIRALTEMRGDTWLTRAIDFNEVLFVAGIKTSLSLRATETVRATTRVARFPLAAVVAELHVEVALGATATRNGRKNELEVHSKALVAAVVTNVVPRDDHTAGLEVPPHGVIAGGGTNATGAGRTGPWFADIHVGPERRDHRLVSDRERIRRKAAERSTERDISVRVHVDRAMRPIEEPKPGREGIFERNNIGRAIVV